MAPCRAKKSIETPSAFRRSRNLPVRYSNASPTDRTFRRRIRQQNGSECETSFLRTLNKTISLLDFRQSDRSCEFHSALLNPKIAQGGTEKRVMD